MHRPIWATCFILMLVQSSAWAQSVKQDVDREVVVMFGDASVQYGGPKVEGALDAEMGIDQRFRSLCALYHVDRIRKAFPDFAERDRARTNDAGRAVGVENLANLHVVRLPADQPRDYFIEKVKELPFVLYAEENVTTMPRAGASEPYFSEQWSMRNTGQSGGSAGADIKVEGAWDYSTGNSTQITGIVDEGEVAAYHLEFGSRVFGDLAPGVDLHATAVAGIAAANGSNNSGIAGINWQTRINTQTVDDLIQTNIAIRAAVDAGATIVNHSWSQNSNTYSPTLASAFAYAYKMNSLSCIASAENGSAWDYPQTYGNGHGVLNVTSTDHTDLRSPWAHPKTYNHVAAPGGGTGFPTATSIRTTSPNEGSSFGSYYTWQFGTSYSAPHVTGLASLLKAYDPSLVNDDIKGLIQFSADDVNNATHPGWDADLGYGRINAQRAFEFLTGVPYRIFRGQVTGGTIHSSTSYLGYFYGLPGGWPDGYYSGTRYEVRATVTFPPGLQSVLAAWGRGVNSTGYNWSIFNNNYCANYIEIVPGTLTSTSATFRTWVYNVCVPGTSNCGWFPTTASNVVFAWTALGRIDTTVGTSVAANWNITGMPTVPLNFSKLSVYPTATSAASRWDVATGSYVVTDPLRVGEGYWIKFTTSPSTITYSGAPIYTYPMRVKKSPVTGWNFVSSIAAPVSTSQVVQNPPGIVTGSYFKYSNGYVAVTTLDPGLGFWVQVTANGTLMMKKPGSPKVTSPPDERDNSDEFILSDNQGGQQKMYIRNRQFNPSRGTNSHVDDIELPPDPPGGLFNIRFGSGKYLQCVEPGTAVEMVPIRIKAATYPVTLEWNLKAERGIEYYVRAVPGAEPVLLASSGTMKIEDPEVRELQLLIRANGKMPREDGFVLNQNSPNPFNPATVIRYSLPRESHVEIKVYNTLGQEMLTAVDELQTAGDKALKIDLSNYPSGVYLYRIVADGFTDIKKMILIR